MTEAQEMRFSDNELGLRDLFQTIWQARAWIAASVVVLGGIAAAVAFLMTPVYRAEVVVVPATADKSTLGNSLGSALGSIGGLASLAGVNLSSTGADVEEALAVLQSRPFLDAFIRDNALLPILFADDWDEQSRRWRRNREPTAAKAHRFFVREVLSVEQDSRSALVAVQVTWSDRELAAQWANDMVARLNAEMRRRALHKAEAAVGYLEKELAGTSILGTQDAISRLIETQINQRMLANVVEEFSFRVVEPAFPPDADDPLRPNKPLVVAAGLTFGAVFGVVGVLLSTLFRPRRRE
jgi:uncharacterized protein involved in exopolysaccharide biosynthesis